MPSPRTHLPFLIPFPSHAHPAQVTPIPAQTTLTNTSVRLKILFIIRNIPYKKILVQKNIARQTSPSSLFKK
jgi:hypothetical protein